jgi:hypothetical protein
MKRQFGEKKSADPEKSFQSAAPGFDKKFSNFFVFGH